MGTLPHTKWSSVSLPKPPSKRTSLRKRPLRLMPAKYTCSPSTSRDTHTSTPAECQTSLTAITDKLRGHLGVGALVSRGLETYGKDPVTYGVKKYLPVEGCTF